MTAGIPAPLTPELAEYVTSALREGKSLIVIAAELKITRTTIYKWMHNHPLFASACTVARAEGSHALIDESLMIADCPILDPNRARNMINARQWAAERRNRKEYGQAVDLNVNQITDLRGTMIEARKRVVLPVCDLAQGALPQPVDYVMVDAASANDKESAATQPAVNPFD
jgi:hypothetical protein